MSRIGNMPIEVPKGVTVDVSERNFATVRGPKGELAQQLSPRMNIAHDGDTIAVSRPTNGRDDRAIHGLTRSLLANMVIGVTDGFEKRLEIQGVGYRAEMQGKQLLMRLGYSHEVIFDPPEGIEFAVEDNTKVVVRGADKQQVGQVAANIRVSRPAEPYKGKGVRYQGEQIRRKAGKAAKVGSD
ncbi:MAG TPA: 50S ribosomal protein L6 [Armatimonadetes bacterium]|nr:50S ribosomal protein L6 [Armatimonadota bacterium]